MCMTCVRVVSIGRNLYVSVAGDTSRSVRRPVFDGLVWCYSAL